MKKKPVYLILLTTLFLFSPYSSPFLKSDSSGHKRVLIDYYHGGDFLYTGTVSRSDFEDNFEFVGFYYQKFNLDDISAFDVIVSVLKIDLTNDEVNALIDYVNSGGGLIVVRSSDNLPQEISNIERVRPDLHFPSRSNAYDLFDFGKGKMALLSTIYWVSNEFSDGKILTDIINLVGAKRIGDRTITPLEYYSETTVTVYGEHITIICPESFAEEVERLDLPDFELSYDIMVDFTGINISNIKVEYEPTVHSDFYAFGVSYPWENRVAFARIPGEGGGIFNHEVAHIFEYYLWKIIYLPSTWVGIIQSIADWKMGRRNSPSEGIFDERGHIRSPRILYLWYALIDFLGYEQFKCFIRNLLKLKTEYTPNDDYWDNLYSQSPDFSEESVYRERAANVINYYVGKTFDIDLTNQIETWGFPVVPWKEVENAINAAKCEYDRSTKTQEIRQLYADTLSTFYGGDFISSESLAIQLISLAQENLDNVPPIISRMIETIPSFLTPNDSVTIRVEISDTGSGVKNATIYYTTDSWITVNRSITMTNFGNKWTATIPKQADGTTVQFKIFAEDNAGNSVESDVTSYTVQAPEPEPAIPGFPIEAILIGIVIAAVALTLLKKKQSIKLPTA